MKLIVTCRPNSASMNMRKVLLEKYPFKDAGKEFEGTKTYQYNDYLLILSQKNVLELDYLKEHFRPEIYLICSTHAAKIHARQITVHPTGNWSAANFGGSNKELCPAPTGFLKNCLERMKELAKEKSIDYEITYEATHHGPTRMNAPLAFIEVGSTEKEWNDTAAIEVAADSLFAPIESKSVPAIGIGGTHYAPKFQGKRMASFAIGHICPKYAVKNLTEDLFVKAIDNCVPRARTALIDWKSIKKEDRDRIINYAKKHGIELVRF